MTLVKEFIVLVFLGCVPVSLENCFSYDCPQHSTLRDCIQGTWTCRGNEICEITTYLSRAGAPWVSMDCQTTAAMYRCLNLHSHNDPGCNPSMHDKVCTWCCDDEVCVRTLASGVYVLPDGHTTPPPPATTSPPPTTNQPLMSTTTTPSPPACSDLYMGDCAADFGGRCGEPIIQHLCQNTCDLPCVGG